MKLTASHTFSAKRGMTILEMTVVIVLLMALVSILFVGATAWRKGTDRSTNLLNLRNCQQAMRGSQNMAMDQTATAFTLGTAGSNLPNELLTYMRFPAHIGGGTTATATNIFYTPGTLYTARGILWLTATYGLTEYPDAAFRPAAAVHADW